MSVSVHRVAVVTGAARGIGAATVHRLIGNGYAVLAIDIAADDPALPYSLGTRAELEAVVSAACAQPDAGTGIAVVADVRDDNAIASAIEQAEQTWGGVDVAIAAAGAIAGGVPQWEMPIPAERAMIEVNLGGTLALARASIPAMLKRPTPRSGRFLAVSSAGAQRGLPMIAAYCAAKAGVEGLVRALAVELGDTGITANAVSPGSTNTPILRESARLYDLADTSEFANQQPMQRLIEPDEVAHVLTILASQANSAMTGAVVPVDAGMAL